jgi:hypothetical protein
MFDPLHDIRNHQITSHLMRAEKKQEENHKLIADVTDHLMREEGRREEAHKLLLAVTDHMKKEEQEIVDYRNILLGIKEDLGNFRDGIIQETITDFMKVNGKLNQARNFIYYLIGFSLIHISLTIYVLVRLIR